MTPTQTLQKIANRIPTTTRIPPRPIPALLVLVLSGVAIIALRSSQKPVGVLVPTHVLRYAFAPPIQSNENDGLVTAVPHAYKFCALAPPEDRNIRGCTPCPAVLPQALPQTRQRLPDRPPCRMIARPGRWS